MKDNYQEFIFCVGNLSCIPVMINNVLCPVQKFSLVFFITIIKLIFSKENLKKNSSTLQHICYVTLGLHYLFINGLLSARQLHVPCVQFLFCLLFGIIWNWHENLLYVTLTLTILFPKFFVPCHISKECFMFGCSFSQKVEVEWWIYIWWNRWQHNVQ